MIDAILGAAGNIGGAIAGQFQQQASQAAQRKALEEIRALYLGLGTPNLPQLAPSLVSSSAGGDVTTDPALAASQQAILQQLQDSATGGGMTGADQAAMNLAQNEAARRGQVQKQALQGLLAARGLGSSGAAIGAQLAGSRDAQARVADAGMQSQVAARLRALQSAGQAGSLASQMRGQQFQERNAAATAKDQWARYNAEAMNRANVYNAGLPQQQWENKFRVTDRVAGATGNIGNQAAQAGQQRAGFTADFGTGLGQMGAGFAQEGARLADAAKAPKTNYADPNYNPYRKAPEPLY